MRKKNKDEKGKKIESKMKERERGVGEGKMRQKGGEGEMKIEKKLRFEKGKRKKIEKWRKKRC